MEVLTAFVRENTKLPGGDKPELEEITYVRQERGTTITTQVENRPARRADIAAILTVLGRRSELEIGRDETEGRVFDLSFTHLAGAELEGAKLQGAYMQFADLHGANLGGADLSRANLASVNFRGAFLRNARLDGTNLRGADLTNVALTQKELEGAFGDERTELPPDLTLPEKKDDGVGPTADFEVVFLPD